MIYLFGIWHNYQCYGEGNDDKADLLKGAVEKAIDDYDIEVIAEEFNEDSFNNPDNSTTVLQSVEQENKNLKHIFCEMSASERSENKIPNRNQITHDLFMNDEEATEEAIKEEERKYYPQREAYWFSILSDYTDYNVLFLCGADHIPSFETLLDEESVDNEVLEVEFDS